MGKHTRRKNRKQNKGNNNNKGGGGGGGNKNNNDNSNKNPTIMRIRHGDARVRHGALAGLSSTLFSPEILSNTNDQKKKGGPDDELIKVLGERVMHDPDVPCAVVAAGCLSNYVTFGGDGSTSSAVKIAPILLARVDRCCADVTVLYGKLEEVKAGTATSSSSSATQMEDSNTTTAKKQKGKKKGKAKPTTMHREKAILALEEQFALACVCLRALCGLVERGSRDEDDNGALSVDDDKLISTLMLVTATVEPALKQAAVVPISSGENSSAATTATTMTTDENRSDDDTMVKKAASEASIIALRTLHAALDDNLPLVQCLLLEKKHVISALISILKSDDSIMPPLARLHAGGCLVAIRQTLPALVPPDGSNTAASAALDEIQAACVQLVLPLLNQTLVFDTTITSPLIVKLCQAAKSAAEEAEDEKMERDAVKATKERREPARLIARRQKLAKEEKERKEANEKMMSDDAAAKVENNVDDSVAMMEDEQKNNDDNDNDMDTDEKKEKEDKREAYEHACNEWSAYCLPLKLSLEITTNLCSSSSSGGGYEEDGDEMMTDTHEMEEEEEECHPLDKELRKTIANAASMDRVLGLIGLLYTSLPAASTAAAAAAPAKDANKSEEVSMMGEVPDLVLEDISELLSKVSACLGNALANLPEWRGSTKKMKEVWIELRNTVVASTQKSFDDDAQKQSLQGMATAAACNSMAAMLRSRPAARSLVGDDDLSLILDLLSNSATTDEKNGKVVSMFEAQNKAKVACWKAESQRDAVAMLGVLCSEPHSDAINDRICTALLTVLQRASSLPLSSGDDLAVINEAFDVLMDMYGCDDDDPNSHSGVFRSKNVLNHFEKSIPLFEDKIKKMVDDRKGMQIVAEEDLDVWMETAMNASRFVEYKKGHS